MPNTKKIIQKRRLKLFCDKLTDQMLIGFSQDSNFFIFTQGLFVFAWLEKEQSINYLYGFKTGEKYLKGLLWLLSNFLILLVRLISNTLWSRIFG